MEAQLEQIREQQRVTWNKFTPGWKKWDEVAMAFLKPMGDEIISSLKLKDTDLVLDIASGTGEPGLTISGVVSKGKVTSTDLSEAMVDVARETAISRGITNFETLVCDACELPFEDNTFDAISCRFGFMFFPDLLQAAKEMARVLKPGGRVAASVWYSPEKNFWITAIMGPLNKNLQLPPPPPDTPGMFRCAKNGFIADLFKQAGLNNIIEKEVPGKINGSVDIYWNFMTEVAAPVSAGLGKADDAMKTKIKNEVFELVNQKFPGGELAIETSALVISGEK